MLNILKNNINYVILTAYEFAKYYNYTFEIYSKHSQEKIYIAPNNISTSEYYDKFKIICDFNQPISLTGSNVNVHLNPGLYVYKIYDTPNLYQLNVDGCDIVERGLLRVYDDNINYIYATNSNTYIVYNE